MTALAPLASVLEAFSAALLEASAGGQPGGQAQAQGTSKGAPFTSLLEDLIEGEQPGAQAASQTEPSAENAEASAAKARPDEKPSSSADQAALALWLGQMPMPLAAPPPPDAAKGLAADEPPTADTQTAQNVDASPPDGSKTAVPLEPYTAAMSGLPAETDEAEAVPATGPTVANPGALELAKLPSPPEAVAQPVVPPVEGARTGSQKSGSAKDAVPAVAPENLTAGADGPPAAAQAEVVAAQAPPAEKQKDDATSEGERKTDKGRGKLADGAPPAASLPPLPVVPQRVEAPADGHRGHEPAPAGSSPAAPREASENQVAATAEGSNVARSAGVSELAFRARLVPVTPAGRQPGQVEPFQPPKAATAPAAAGEPAPAVKRPEAAEAADDERRPAVPPQPKAETRVEVQPQTEGDASLQPVPPAAVRDAASPAATPERSSAATGTETARPAEPPQPSNLPELKQTTLRDIRFEVNGPDRRVEVRLTERAGEVEVSVRTPDSRLAADLRENLPLLSSRLEQTGFRSEGLAHDGGLAAGAQRHDVRQTAESGTGDPGQGSREPGERQGEGQHQQRPRTPEEIRDSKSKGKDFSWFLSTQA